MVCLKEKSEFVWYNSAVEPNVGTCLFLEIGQQGQVNSGDASDDSSLCSDAELIDFLQSNQPEDAQVTKRKISSCPDEIRVLGKTEERMFLRSRAYGAKPTQAATVFDVRDNQVKPAPRLKTNVTERTIQRRRRRELKLIQKQKKVGRLEVKREISHQTKTKIKVELL